MLLAPTWKVTVVPGAVAWGAGWLVMRGWPKQMLTVARNMSKAAPAVWIAFMNMVVCFSVCPDLVRLIADCQDCCLTGQGVFRPPITPHCFEIFFEESGCGETVRRVAGASSVRSGIFVATRKPGIWRSSVGATSGHHVVVEGRCRSYGAARNQSRWVRQRCRS